MRWGVSITIGICYALASSSDAVAGSLDDAQAQLSKAYNDYYSTLRKTPPKSPEEAKKISDRTLGPANRAVEQALRQEHEQALKNLGVSVVQSTNSNSGHDTTPIDGVVDRAPSSESQAVAKGADSGSPAVSSSTQPKIKRPGRPEQQLDGARIPKEIKFGQ